MILLPGIDLDEDLGQHYNSFSFSYQVFDNDAGITVTERIDGHKIRTFICDNKDVINVEIPKHIWRGLECGEHTFMVQAIDINNSLYEQSATFSKVDMPWYGESSTIRISGLRKPQKDLIDLKSATVKVLSSKTYDKAHIVQDVEIDNKYFVKDKLRSGEHFIHKVSTGGASINLINRPKGQVVLSNKDVDLSNVKVIKGFEYEGENAFMLISFDKGVSWNGRFNYETDRYEVVDLNDLNDVISKSINITSLDDLNIDRLNQAAEILPIRLGYVLPTATSRIDKFGMNVTVSGVFERVNDEDYKVEYVNDTMIRITFNSDGTYKVNYIAGELTESEYSELSNTINEIIKDIDDIKDNGVKVTLPEIDIATDFVPLRYNSNIEYEDGKLVKEIYTGDVEKIVEYKYDGRLITEKIVTDSFGTKKSIYTYDNYNRLISITDEGTENSMSAGVIGMPIRHNVSLEYDEQNRVTLEVYSGTENKRVTYEYIGSHTKRKTVTHSNGEQFVAVYNYDLSGNLISVEDGGVEKIYTPLNANAVTRPRTISKAENTIVLTELTDILAHNKLKEENNFNVILNSEILVKNEYGEKSDSIVTLIIEQDGIVMEEIHLYPQEVQKYYLGSSEGLKVIAKGRLSYSYSVGVI